MLTNGRYRRLRYPAAFGCSRRRQPNGRERPNPAGRLSWFGGLRFYVGWNEDGLPEPEGKTPEPTVTRHPGSWLLSGQYLHPVKRVVAHLIVKAGEDSYRACDWCGARAQTVLDGGWVYTACPDHSRPDSITVADYERRMEVKAKKNLRRSRGRSGKPAMASKGPTDLAALARQYAGGSLAWRDVSEKVEDDRFGSLLLEPGPEGQQLPRFEAPKKPPPKERCSKPRWRARRKCKEVGDDK